MALTDGSGATMTMPVAPVANGGYGSGFGGFGNGDGWWIILFLIIVMGGWNGNGWGNNGGGTLEGYTQSNDFSNLERENDIIRSDICNQFANVNQTLANGFQTIQTSFANAELSRSNTQAAIMGQLYAQNLASVQANCTAAQQTAEGFNTTNYNMAAQGTAMQNAMNVNTRDILEANNANTRSILDALNAQRLEAKDEKIAEQAQQISALQLAASQAAQNNTLINQLRPSPVPAYQVANPYAYSGYGCNCGNYAS